MHHAGSTSSVIFDASPVRRFCDAGLLPQLFIYLPKAAIVAEVARELDDASKSRKNQAIADYRDRCRWPHRIAGITSPAHLADAAILLDILRKKNPAKDHVGEVATILRAKELSTGLVIMDDSDARKFGARPRNVPTLSTAALAVEMTRDEALEHGEGLKLFLLASDDTDEPTFKKRLNKYRRSRAGRT